MSPPIIINYHFMTGKFGGEKINWNWTSGQSTTGTPTANNHKGTPKVKNGAKYEACEMPQGGEEYGQEEREYTQSEEDNRSCGLDKEPGRCGKERECIWPINPLWWKTYQRRRDQLF